MPDEETYNGGLIVKPFAEASALGVIDALGPNCLGTYDTAWPVQYVGAQSARPYEVDGQEYQLVPEKNLIAAFNPLDSSDWVLLGEWVAIVVDKQEDRSKGGILYTHKTIRAQQQKKGFGEVKQIGLLARGSDLSPGDRVCFRWAENPTITEIAGVRYLVLPEVEVAGIVC